MVTVFVLGGWVFFRRFLSDNPVAVEGWSSLMVVILGFGGFSVFFLGEIVELVYMTMSQLQGKPTFFVVNRTSDSKLAQELKKLEASCKY